MTPQSINLTPYAGRVTTACKGADYVTNRAVAVGVGPVACSDLLFMRRRRVRLCKADSVPHLFYVADKNVAVDVVPDMPVFDEVSDFTEVDFDKVSKVTISKEMTLVQLPPHRNCVAL